MKLSQFDSLPNQAHLWIYGFQAPLTSGQQAQIDAVLNRFLDEWVSHGRPVSGAFACLYDRFVLLSGFQDEGISGCSVDSSVNRFRFLRDRLGLDALNRSLIYFRSREETIEAVPFGQFQDLVRGGEVNESTPVFDTTLQRLGELREGKFETAFRDAWHWRNFGVSSRQTVSR